MSAKVKKWSGPLYRRVGLGEIPRLHQFSDLELRVWLQARMGRQSNRIGFGPFSVGSLAEDVGDFELAAVRAAFERVVSALHWRFDGTTRWLLQPEVLEVAWDGSPAQLIGYLREIERQNPPADQLEAFKALATTLHERKTSGGTTPQTTRMTSPVGSVETTMETSGGQALVLVHEQVPEQTRAARARTHRGHIEGFCHWVCLPQLLIDEFRGKSEETDDDEQGTVDERIIQWAAQIKTEWQGRSIGDDCWDFWRARWRELRGTTVQRRRVS